MNTGIESAPWGGGKRDRTDDSRMARIEFQGIPNIFANRWVEAREESENKVEIVASESHGELGNLHSKTEYADYLRR